ncbi:MAG: ribonuclease HII [Bacteroidota bacterium]
MLQPFHTKGISEAGVDEAGRGCLAGPVVAAAVILPNDFNHPDLDDSKKVSKEKRLELRDIIISEALDYAVAEIDNKIIDDVNILNASFKAMHEAISKLKNVPDHLLIDGNRFKAYKAVKHSCIIKGDGIYTSIAAASILAKTYRDELMEGLHHKYPIYMWNKNVGYPTQAHRDAIRKKGISPYHRKTFRLLPEPAQIPA